MAETAKIADTEPEAERRDQSAENRLKRSVFDVPVKAIVCLGSVKLKVREILELETDAVFPLEAQLDDPVELIVEGRVVAYGELKETDDGGMAIVIVEIPMASNHREDHQ